MARGRWLDRRALPRDSHGIPSVSNQQKTPAMKSKNSSGFMDTVKTIVYAVVFALIIRTVGFEPFNIPSASMVPTLLVGDYLFVSKYSYGYSRYSLPFGLPLIPGRIFYTQPERGDVAVFKTPEDNKTDYIKRIVGLPGDRIQVKGGVLHINGSPVKREVVNVLPGCGLSGYKLDARSTGYIETLPNGRSHVIREQDDQHPLDNTREFAVPADHFFAMGDNRDNSQDSRVESAVGFVPIANLVGRAEFLFFSTDGSARLWEFWKWPFALRFNRFFCGIE
jgi:signal peptidase I